MCEAVFLIFLPLSLLQVLCLLALPGGSANHAEATYGPGTIPETTARNPLDFDAETDDEMTTFSMENHYHCLERDDWEHFHVGPLIHFCSFLSSLCYCTYF